MGFDPISMAATAASALFSKAGIGAIATAGAGAVSAAAAYQQRKAAALQADYAAELQERQAGEESRRAKENQRRAMENRREYLATVRVRQAASGLRTGQGSPLAVLGEITSRADEQIYDLTEQMAGRVSLLRDQARMSRWQADQHQQAAPWELFGNLLQSGVRGAGAYSRGRKFYGGGRRA